MNQFIDAYRRHGNIKNASIELGISWQNLYCKLKALDEPIIHDKLKYGSDRDRLGALAEIKFSEIVKDAVHLGKTDYQAKVDFSVNNWLVDVKSSLPRKLSKKYDAMSWSFSFKKQTFICDFFCCFCMNERKENGLILLVPKEFFSGLQTISVSIDGYSKWKDYSVTESELKQFFLDLGSKK